MVYLSVMEGLGPDMISTEFWIQILVYGVSTGVFAGTILTKIAYLEKKIDKHSELIERMVRVEQSAKSAHLRIDSINKPAAVRNKKARI